MLLLVVHAVTLAIEGVINDGVVVVIGAGNTNEPAGNTVLPNIERAITVGGTDGFDARSFGDALSTLKLQFITAGSPGSC